ncbi:MAG: MFS transporter, partial [Flavobacteriia bacterium]|nr:MFS transporter [Flavobacteriia bacterium]
IIGMILLTIGEMISSPFSNAIALEMAPKGRKGSYMGVFSMSYSIAHIVGHNTGMNLVSALGFKSTWYITSFFLAFIIGLILWLHYILKRKKMDIR